MPIGAAIKWPKLRRLVQALLSLSLAISLEIALSARFAWLYSHAEKWDTPAQMPTLILCELPLLLCLLLLVTGESSKRAVRSAGMAFGIALSFCAIVLPLGCDAAFTAWENLHGDLAAFQQFLPVCVIASVWMLAVAWRHGKGQRSAFAVSVGCGIGCFVLVALLLNFASVYGSGEEKEKARYELTPIRPEFHIIRVAGCLIRHHSLHPDEGFPSSLSDIKPDWNCEPEISDPWAMHGYWILYFPVDRSSNGFQDFRVGAILPEQSRLVSAADKRGEVLRFTGPSQNRGHFEVDTVEADGNSSFLALFTLRDTVKTYMSAHDPANAPSSLDGVVDLLQWSRRCEEEGTTPQDRVIGRGGTGFCYTISYFPPSASPDANFALSVQCINYGDGCLRSYFLDYDGKIHATSELRAATAQDAELLPCEAAAARYSSICNDPVWTASERPSERTFLQAKVLYLIHSTNWW